MKLFKRATGGFCVIQLALIIFVLVGEVKCVVKAVRCDWNPVGKAEVLYTGAALTGLGAIVGWIDIEDGTPVTVNTDHETEE